MPDIFSNTNDGKIDTGNVSGHSTARGASSGTATANENSSNSAIKYFRSSGRGATTVAIARSFFFFNTSGVTGTVASATLDISFSSNVFSGGFNIILAKSDAFGGDGGTALSNDDFNNVDFSTAYASAVGTGGSTTGTATFTLNATALADIKNNDAFIVALLESDHDFSDSEPSDLSKTLAITFAETGGNSSDPKLSYTLATGYSHDIMAVAAASIGKVNTVATANISKVIGA